MTRSCQRIACPCGGAGGRRPGEGRGAGMSETTRNVLSILALAGSLCQLGCTIAVYFMARWIRNNDRRDAQRWRALEDES